MEMELAETFAKFVAHTEFNDVDESVIEYVKQLTLKQVMGMLVGYGCGFRTDVAQAALLNGFFGHASEMEDDQFPGGGISDVTTWPALLTASEKCKLSGQEIIVALYVGQELQNRIAMWASVGTDPIGICNLPFIGIYGATASCARAFELTEEETKASFGLAMVQGLGYMHTWGTDAHFYEFLRISHCLSKCRSERNFGQERRHEQSGDREVPGHAHGWR
jgi:hypothetical protein